MKIDDKIEVIIIRQKKEILPFRRVFTVSRAYVATILPVEMIVPI